MSSINVLIIEDDLSFALEVEMLIDKLGYKLVKTVDNSEEALDLIKAKHPDVVLVDLYIEGPYDGIQLAKVLSNKHIPFIFFTASNDLDLYRRAASLKPQAYLVKPFDQLTLQAALERVVEMGEQETGQSHRAETWNDSQLLRDSFFIKSHNQLEKVALMEINWIHSEGNYCIIQTSKRKFVIKISLTRIKQKFPPELFVQIHRSYVVQVQQIQHIDISNNELQLEDQILPIGRKYKSDLLTRLNLL
ncbi:MAG: response regulator transcription factor [Bacteroidota bacterium]